MSRHSGFYVSLLALALLILALASIRAGWPSYITWASFGAGVGLVAASIWNALKPDGRPPESGESR